ncbi:MAG TPA: SEC-C metal-binding domain-containing protein [Acidimicrobiia bacterium]|nr:SEC-C metal-binding domain-containing protein [Acidimicrobiia bacterium]
MDLDRGALARLDRRLLAGLDRDERFQMVRVPVTPAKWSTWKRLCDTAGISMGRAIAALINHEMASVLDNSSEGAVSTLEERAQRQLVDREAALSKREGELSAAEERVRRWSEHLREKEQELEVREWRVDAVTKLSTQPPQVAKTGRNERCPCGSGLKYKRCHGDGRPSKPWE